MIDCSERLELVSSPLTLVSEGGPELSAMLGFARRFRIVLNGESSAKGSPPGSALSEQWDPRLDRGIEFNLSISAMALTILCVAGIVCRLIFTIYPIITANILLKLDKKVSITENDRFHRLICGNNGTRKYPIFRFYNTHFKTDLRKICLRSGLG